METKTILDFINQDPKKYLARVVGKRVEIAGKASIISRDMSGNLIVSHSGQVFEFQWSSGNSVWVSA